MERKENFVVGEYYHVYERGHNKDQIFLSDKDYLRFLILLYTSNGTETIHLSDYPSLDLSRLFKLDRGEPLVAIGAYCLMPNHLHLLIKEIRENGLSLFMQKTNTSFSKFFNKKYAKTGSPLEKPFKAKHIDNDEYLKYLFAYIHLNPVKSYDPEAWANKSIVDPKRALEFIQIYRFSSYRSYAGLNPYQDKILNIDSFPEYFGQVQDFSDFVEDWIRFSDESEEKSKEKYCQSDTSHN